MKRTLPFWILLAGCNVDAPPADTGGAVLPEGVCGRGLVVVASDYISSSVALTDTDGRVVSESVISSGSAAPGLGAAVSGDLAAPWARPKSGRIVLLDRYPAGVLTWLDAATGAVTGQLAVSPGVKTNPQDYLELDDRKAYVSRYDSNPAPGKAPFDEGGDILVIDHRAMKPIARIAMPVDGDVLPRPTRMTRLGATVVVPLDRLSANFRSAADGAFVGIDPTTDAIAWRVDLPGLASCGAAIASRNGKRLAIMCSGLFHDGPAAQLARSGVAVFDGTTTPPRLIDVIHTDTPPSQYGDAEDDTHLLLVLYGDRDKAIADRLVRVDLDTGTTTQVLAAPEFTLGEVRCMSGCGKCAVADASNGGLHFVTPTTETFSPVVSRGLPPRYVTQF